MSADLPDIWKCKLCGQIGADMWPWIKHLAAHVFGGAQVTAASGVDREPCGCPIYGLRMNGNHQQAHTRECQLVASGADQPTLRDQLAERTWDILIAAGLNNAEAVAAAHAIARIHLPLIEADRERAKAEGGAEALEKAAENCDSAAWPYPLAGEDDPTVGRWLRDRAAALRGSTGGAG